MAFRRNTIGLNAIQANAMGMTIPSIAGPTLPQNMYAVPTASQSGLAWMISASAAWIRHRLFPP